MERQTTPQGYATMEPIQQTGHFHGKAKPQDSMNLNNRTHRTMKPTVLKLEPSFWTTRATSSLWSCEWLTGNHQSSISTNPTNPKGWLVATSREIHVSWYSKPLHYWNYPSYPHARPKTERRCRITSVANSGNLTWNTGTATEQFREKTCSKSVLSLNNNQISRHEAQETNNNITAEK